MDEQYALALAQLRLQITELRKLAAANGISARSELRLAEQKLARKLGQQRRAGVTAPGGVTATRLQPHGR